MATNAEIYHDRIVADPEILLGKPVIAGTRISVEQVLSRLAYELDLQTLFDDYPRLTIDDVRACLAYAADLVAGVTRPVAPSPARPSDKA